MNDNKKEIKQENKTPAINKDQAKEIMEKLSIAEILKGIQNQIKVATENIYEEKEEHQTALDVFNKYHAEIDPAKYETISNKLTTSIKNLERNYKDANDHIYMITDILNDLEKNKKVKENLEKLFKVLTRR